MNTNTRIQLTDTTFTAVFKLAEGNPGATRVCAEILALTPTIDPDSALGGLGALLSLDSLGIYGSRIWMLYKDMCHECIYNTVAVLRAHQLGIISAKTLHHAIDNRGDGVSTLNTFAQVQAQLPRFAQDMPHDRK